MSWFLRVKTATDEHLLDFEGDKGAADAALEETMQFMRSAGPHSKPVKIADQLVVVDKAIQSANVYEAL